MFTDSLSHVKDVVEPSQLSTSETSTTLKIFISNDGLQNIARSSHLEVSSRGPTIRPLLASLRANFGVSGDTLVHIYRGSTLCFVPTTVDSWLSENKNDDTP